MQDFVTETAILRSNLTTGQSSAAGCVIAGSVHFNMGILRFKGGEVHFTLRNADIVLSVAGGQLSHAAYIHEFEEAFSFELTEGYTREQTAKKTRSAGGEVSVSTKDANLQLAGALKHEHGDDAAHASSATLKTQADQSRIAFSYQSDGGRWMCTGAQTLLAGEMRQTLFGRALQKGEDGESVLAEFVANDPDWAVRAKVEFSAADVNWHKFNITNNALQTVASWIMDRHRPESFFSRVAMAKWLSKMSGADFFFEARPPGGDDA